MIKISKYWKGVIAGLSPVALAVTAAVTDDKITQGEWVGIGIAVLVAFGVISVPNSTTAQRGDVPSYPSQEKTL